MLLTECLEGGRVMERGEEKNGEWKERNVKIKKVELVELGRETY